MILIDASVLSTQFFVKKMISAMTVDGPSADATDVRFGERRQCALASEDIVACN